MVDKNPGYLASQVTFSAATLACKVWYTFLLAYNLIVHKTLA